MGREMGYPVQFNDFIRPLIAITDLLVQLRSLYKSTAPLIKEEHAAIGHGDLNTIDRLAIQKNSLAADISKKTEEVGYNLQRLSELIEKYTPLAREISLSTCMEALSTIVTQSQDGADNASLQNKIFHTIFSRFQSEITLFKNDMKDVQPLIETHYFVVQKGLRYIQNSYKFWQSLASEADATYTPRGKQKNQELSSLLRIKA